MPTWYETVLGFVLPATCLNCQAEIVLPGCCGYCEQQLPRLGPHCERCAKLLSARSVCGRCRFNPPAFRYTVVPFQYAAPVTDWITGFKFHEQLLYSDFLANCLWQSCRTHYQNHCWPQLIIPVPLHQKRLQERGFNQASLLAAYLAKRTGIALARNTISKVRATAPQTSLNKRARVGNTKRAFAINGSIYARHVALVDDVLTTGATVNEIAKVLLKSGVEQVDVWCVARTV